MLHDNKHFLNHLIKFLLFILYDENILVKRRNIYKCNINKFKIQHVKQLTHTGSRSCRNEQWEMMRCVINGRSSTG